MNPLGPVHKNVNGPAEPATVISIAPLKAGVQRVLSVTTEVIVNVDVLSGTLMMAVIHNHWHHLLR